MNAFSNVTNRGGFSSKSDELRVASVGNKFEINSYFGEKNWSDLSVEFGFLKWKIVVFLFVVVFRFLLIRDLLRPALT